MSKALILGAGASHGHGAEAQMRPPMASQFFSGPAYEEATGSYEALWEYIESTLRINVHDSSQSDIENLFAHVEPAWKIGLHDLMSVRRLLQRVPRDLVWVSPVVMLMSFVAEGALSLEIQD